MILFLAIASLILFSSALPYQPPPTYERPREALTIYQVAELRTGAPAAILKGIAITESGEKDGAIGDGGESVGRFQLREIYHRARASEWGEYNPRNPSEAAIIAGHIYMRNFKILGSEELAIAAYRQGIAGVKKNGPTGWYVERVRSHT